MKLGDDYQYTIKGSGESSYKKDFSKSMKMQDVLYIPGLKKNLLSISALDAKGLCVAFVDGQVFMWPRGKTIDNATIIGEQEGGMYKLKGQPEKALVHDSIEPSELCHRRLAHVHYRALPIVNKTISGLREFQTKHEGAWKGCAQGKNAKKLFPSSECITKKSWQ